MNGFLLERGKKDETGKSEKESKKSDQSKKQSQSKKPSAADLKYENWIKFAKSKMVEIYQKEYDNEIQEEGSQEKDEFVKENLEAILSRNQFQAPISYRKGESTERNSNVSPLNVTAYVRGTETKVWKLLNHLQVDNIKYMCEGYVKNKETLALGKLSSYEVYSMSMSIKIMGEEPLKCKDIESFWEKFSEEIERNSYYIESENALLIKSTLLDEYVDKDGKKMEVPNEGSYKLKDSLKHFSNCKGLRLSINQSIEKACELMNGYMKRRKYSKEVIEGMLGKIVEYGEKVNLGQLFPQGESTENRVEESGEIKPNESESPIACTLGSQNDRIAKMEKKLKNIEQESGWDLQIFFTNNLEIAKILMTYVFEKPEINNIIKKFESLVDKLEKCISNTAQEEKSPETAQGEKQSETAQGKKSSETEGDSLGNIMDDFYYNMQVFHQLVKLSMKKEHSSFHFVQSLMELTDCQKSDNSSDVESIKPIKPNIVLAMPYGMTIYEKLRMFIEGKKQGVNIISDGYFETPEIFEQCEKVGNKTVFIMEPHPNNAAKDEVNHNDPIKFIEEKMKSEQAKSGGITVIMDVTLNCLADDEIHSLLRDSKVNEWISSGKLNLILLQSGTKFYTLGMDIASVGVAMVYNSDKKWKSFNEEFLGKDKYQNGEALEKDKEQSDEVLEEDKEQSAEALEEDKVQSDEALEEDKVQSAEIPEKEKTQSTEVPKEDVVLEEKSKLTTKYKILIPKKDRIYISEMLKLKAGGQGNSYYQKQYINKIKSNTKLLYDKLVEMNSKENYALSVLKSTEKTDNSTTNNTGNVYVAVKLKDKVVEDIKGEPSVQEDINLQLLNVKYLFPTLRDKMRPLRVYDRQSFGFLLTNIGECGTTIRITLGVEPGERISKYAEVIKQLSEEIQTLVKSGGKDKIIDYATSKKK